MGPFLVPRRPLDRLHDGPWNTRRATFGRFPPPVERPLQLTLDRFFRTSPTWSPDGGRIVFAREDRVASRTGYDLYVIPAEGGAGEQLTDDPGRGQGTLLGAVLITS